MLIKNTVVMRGDHLGMSEPMVLKAVRFEQVWARLTLEAVANSPPSGVINLRLTDLQDVTLNVLLRSSHGVCVSLLVFLTAHYHSLFSNYVPRFKKGH